MDTIARVALAAGGLAAGALAGALVFRARPEGPRARVVRIIAEITPSDTGDPKFDAILGGRIGPGRWRYYEQGYGTTCAIFVVYVLSAAGALAECINRGPSFQNGAHASRLLDCARRRGAYRPGIDGISPGDVYYVSDQYQNWHIGHWIRREGSSVLTADGGQTNARGLQCARFIQRRIEFDGRGQASLSGPGGRGGLRRVLWNADIARLFPN